MQTEQESIKKILQAWQQRKGTKILFAVENGSRAWRMESADSDYDIRFVFYRPAKEYIALSPPAEVDNMAFNDKLEPCLLKDALYDFSGFDIFKYLHLLKKSNPTAIEWLLTDIVYTGIVPTELKDFAEKFFSPTALIYHYASLARKNLIIMRNRQKYTAKKYLYVYRGLANALFVQNTGQLPDICFPTTLAACRQYFGEARYDLLCRLIETKKLGQEKEEIGPQPLLDDFADNFRPAAAPVDKNGDQREKLLNAYLRKLLTGDAS